MPHHAHSIDRWDDATGSNLYEHLVGVNDLLLAFRSRRQTVARRENHAAQRQEDHREDVAGGRLKKAYSRRVSVKNVRMAARWAIH
jgi:hypothetical protein